MVVGLPIPNDYYQNLVHQIYHSTDFDFVGVALQDDFYPYSIRWRFVAGNQNQRFRKIILRRGFGIAGLVLRTGKPFLSNELSKFAYSSEMYTPIAAAESLQSAAAVPLKSNLGIVNGVLLVGFRNNKKIHPSVYEKLSHLMERH